MDKDYRSFYERFWPLVPDGSLERLSAFRGELDAKLLRSDDRNGSTADDQQLAILKMINGCFRIISADCKL
jgi:hypothetical protein